MAYTAYNLITRAYYLSQVVSRQLQTVDPYQVTDGLYLLNALLEIKGSDLRLIPYFQEYVFSTIANQEKYFVENLLYVDSLTFIYDSVRFPMTDKTRRAYFATARVQQLYSLPFTYRPERTLNGTDIYLYYIPNQVYEMHLWGKFGLSDVALETDLSLTYDLFYIEYLRYALAEYICSEYAVSFPDESKAKFAEIRKKLMDISPADLSIQKFSYFNNKDGIDWQIANLSVGYLPY